MKEKPVPVVYGRHSVFLPQVVVVQLQILERDPRIQVHSLCVDLKDRLLTLHPDQPSAEHAQSEKKIVR